MNKHKIRHFKNELQAILKFTDEDLALNRQGFLSDAQEAHIRNTTRLEIGIVLLPAPIIFLFGIYSESPENTNSEAIFLVSILLFIFGVYAGFKIWRRYWKSLDLDEELQRAVGKLWLDKGSQGNSYYIDLDGERFPISLKLYRHFENDYAKFGKWVIYYLPNPRRIISVEKLPNG